MKIHHLLALAAALTLGACGDDDGGQVGDECHDDDDCADGLHCHMHDDEDHGECEEHEE